MDFNHRGKLTFNCLIALPKWILMTYTAQWALPELLTHHTVQSVEAFAHVDCVHAQVDARRSTEAERSYTRSAASIRCRNSASPHSMPRRFASTSWNRTRHLPSRWRSSPERDARRVLFAVAYHSPVSTRQHRSFGRKHAASHSRDHRSAAATPLLLLQSASVACRYLSSFAFLDQCGLLGRLRCVHLP